MLRRTAAAAAWLLLPAFGYFLSLFFPAQDYSNSTSPDSSTASKPSKKQMIYSSKSALPSEWDSRRWGRNQPAQQYLKVDGLSVKYTGPGETDAQAASIYADKPVPQDVPLYYFEITVVSKGDQGFIGIGFCTADVNLGRLPGWEPHSYGYHGDDGHIFHGSGLGRSFGPRFTTGDVVGALLDRGANTISYYKNGEFVGVAFTSVTEERLHPCVGMRTPNEEIRANFGAAPFTTDLAALQAQFKERVLNSIAAVKLPAAVELAAPAIGAAAGEGSGKGLAETPAAAAGVAAAAADVRNPLETSSSAAAIDAALAAFDAAVADAEATMDADVPTAAAAAAAEGRASGSSSSNYGGSSSNATNVRHQPLLPYLIFDYLLHQRCWRTAALVARDMLEHHAGSSNSSNAETAAAGAAEVAAALPMECNCSEDAAMTAASVAAAAVATPSTSPTTAALSQADIQDALRRQKIFDAVVAGQLTEAFQQVQQHYGAAALDSNPALAFKLKVQQFVELVRQASSSSSSSSSMTCFEAALAYGRAELGPASKTQADEELLSDALSLLAYADPAASPCGHLLRPAQRVELAEQLNGALLQARGASPQPLLEAVYRQAAVLLDELKRQSHPQAFVLDVAGMCLKGEAAQLQQQRQRKAQRQQAGSSAAAAAAIDTMQQDRRVAAGIVREIPDPQQGEQQQQGGWHLKSHLSLYRHVSV